MHSGAVAVLRGPLGAAGGRRGLVGAFGGSGAARGLVVVVWRWGFLAIPGEEEGEEDGQASGRGGQASIGGGVMERTDRPGGGWEFEVKRHRPLGRTEKNGGEGVSHTVTGRPEMVFASTTKAERGEKTSTTAVRRCGRGARSEAKRR